MTEESSADNTPSKSSDPLSHAGAAEHRSGAAYSADLVSISRRVLYAQAALIAVVAAIFFLAGYAIGPGRDIANEQPVEKPEKFGESVDVYGRITFGDSAGNITNDAGAVVILIPKGSEPADRFASAGLRPGDAESDGEDTIDAIKFLGGAHLQADENGEVDFQARTGRYYVLVISNGSTRPEGRGIKTQDLRDMKKFFADPKSLVGENRYDWELRKLDKKSLFNVSLD